MTVYDPLLARYNLCVLPIIVEIEISVLRGQRVNRLAGERETLMAQLDAWKRRDNASGA